MPTCLAARGGTVPPDLYEAVRSETSSSPSDGSRTRALADHLLGILFAVVLVAVTLSWLLIEMDTRGTSQEIQNKVLALYAIVLVVIVLVWATASATWGRAPGERCQFHLRELACCALPMVFRHCSGPPMGTSAATPAVPEGISLIPASERTPQQKAPTPLTDAHMDAADTPRNATRLVAVKSEAENRRGRHAYRELDYGQSSGLPPV